MVTQGYSPSIAVFGLRSVSSAAQAAQISELAALNGFPLPKSLLWRTKMGTTGYRVTYLAAFDQANAHLRGLYQEYERLQLRKEQIEDALTALEPFLDLEPVLDSKEAQIHEVPHMEPAVNVATHIEPAHQIPEPVMTMPTPPAPPVSATFAPVAETEMDPIQRRINHALGLAVA